MSEYYCDICPSDCRLKNFQTIRDNYSAIDSFKYNPQTHSTPINVLLAVTNRCNLQCSYCFVQQNSQDMTYEIADKAIQWALSNITDNQSKPIIGFFGGEPLLKFDDIIVPIVEKYKNQIEFNITTNGVLLTEDIVDFFLKNDVLPLLSFDGIAQVQNSQRSNSFDQVLNNIPYLLLRFPYTTMRATVTKESIPFLFDTVVMANELGFKSLFFCENAYEDWDKTTETLLEEQFSKIGLYIYQKLKAHEPILKINPFNRIFSSIYDAQQDNLFFDNRIMRCGLGTTSCAVIPNGDIIPCQEKSSNPTTILGNVFTGINEDIHKHYLMDYFNKINNIECDKGCSEKDKLICLSHLCPSRLEDLNYKFSTATCAFSRMATKITLRLFFLCSYSDDLYIKEYWEGEND